MAMAMTVRKYLSERKLPYEVHNHMHTGSSLRSAAAAHVPAHALAKAVVLEDDDGYLMAVLPADRHVHFSWVRQATGRSVGLATERELVSLFKDCDIGAVPPLGEAYGMDTIVDESLDEAAEVYFEAGDHEELIHMTRDDFLALHPRAQRAHIAAPGP